MTPKLFAAGIALFIAGIVVAFSFSYLRGHLQWQPSAPVAPVKPVDPTPKPKPPFPSSSVFQRGPAHV